MKSVMLACKRVKGRHTSENIHLEYEGIVANFDIAGKISHIVTDNAANMVKAFNFELPGFNIGEEHNRDSDSNTESDYGEDGDNEPVITDMVDDTVYELIPERDPCFAHSLQLVVKDGLNAAEGQISKLLARASKIVSHGRKSN